MLAEKKDPVIKPAFKNESVRIRHCVNDEAHREFQAICECSIVLTA